MSSANSEGITGFYSCTFDSFGKETYQVSHKFTIDGVDDCDFEIQLFKIEVSKSYQIIVKKSNKTRVFAEITISFLGGEMTRIVHDWIDTCAFAKEQPKFRNNVVWILQMNCRIIWYGTKEDSITVKPSLSPFSEFQNFHSNSSLSDLKISISGEELSAHKFILAAHSPVFLRMFETDMKERRESRIVIEGIDLDVMKIVLSILYTGYDEGLFEVEMIGNVLGVAERYDMKTLKRLCEWKLFRYIYITNVVDILDIADKFNAELLRTECMKFIIQNKKELAKSEDLKSVCQRKPNVMWELLQMSMMIDDELNDQAIG